MTEENKSLPLPLKYRPDYLEDVVGNETAIKAITSILKREMDKIPHSWLLTGPSGCGKTTLARIIKEELGCDDFCFMEYNASNTRGIDTIREVQNKAVMYPRSGNVKVYLFDECHMLTREAMNALLKLLEDPPAHAYFLLATTNPEKLIKPIHSRCTTIKVSKVTTKKLRELVYLVLTMELGEDEAKQFPSDVLEAVAKNSDGACRDALKLLDMIIEMDNFDDMIKAVQQGVPQEGEIKELCDMLKTPRTKWKEMGQFLKRFDEDPEKVRRIVLSWFSNMLLDDGSLRTAKILEAFESNYFDNGKAGLYLSCFHVTLIK